MCCVCRVLSPHLDNNPRAYSTGGGHRSTGSSLGIVDTGTTLLVPPSHAYPALVEAITRGLHCTGATAFASRCVGERRRVDRWTD